MRWAAYASVEPFGEWAANVRHAQWCALYANAHRNDEKHQQPFTARDFMPFGNEDDAPPADNWTPEDGATIDPMLMATLMSAARKTEKAKHG